MKTEFKVNNDIKRNGECFSMPDMLELILTDRHDALRLIGRISREISKPENKEITINLVGEYVRTKED